MPARSQFVRLATKFGMLFGALFVVTVLLAAMPGHHAPGTQSQEPQPQSSAAQSQQQQQQPSMDPNMIGMDMDDAKASEANAVHDMITSRITGTASSNRSRLIQHAPLPCSTKKPRAGMNSSVPCTRCRNARRKNKSMNAFR